MGLAGPFFAARAASRGAAAQVPVHILRRRSLPCLLTARRVCTGSDRRPFKLSKALCAVAHDESPCAAGLWRRSARRRVRLTRACPCTTRSCLAIGGLKSSSGSHSVQVAQSLPRPSSERPMKQYACRLHADDVPVSLSWRKECALLHHLARRPVRLTRGVPAAFFSVAAALGMPTYSKPPQRSCHSCARASTQRVRRFPYSARWARS